MSTIILPNRWKRQPTGPVDIDWGNPLTAGLKSVVCPSLPQTLITNERIVTVGTGTIEGRQHGKAIVCASGSYGAQVAADGDTLLPSNDSGNECTILVYSRFTDTTNRASSLFGFVGTNRVQAHMPYSDGTVYWDYGGTGNRRTTYAGFTKTTNAETYAFQYGVINPYRAIWRNRQLLASGTTVDTAARGATTEPFYVGGAYGQTGDNVEVYLLAVVNHVMSAGEIHAFNENPWQIFKKRAKILYFPSAGGGGATIAADSGTYALTGTAVTLQANRKLAADSGSYTLTGSDVSLRVGRKLAADSGTYSLSGTDVAFKRGYALSAASGTYTLNGTDVSLKANRKLAADSGTYSLTGTNVALTYSPAGSYSLTAESGSYTLSGTSATLRVNRKLVADSGTYTLTGTAATVAKGYRLTTDSGTYTLTGSAVAFARTYRLVAESGSYVLAGSNAALTWSGAPVVIPDPGTGGGGSRRVIISERKVRDEVDEWLKRKQEAEILKRIQREDEEICLIMALLAA